MSKKPKAEADPLAERPADFEADLEALETVVRELEAGNAPLGRSLELFERGVGLLDKCRKTLDSAETRIRELVTIADDGSYRFKPFKHQASADAE